VLFPKHQPADDIRRLRKLPLASLDRNLLLRAVTDRGLLHHHLLGLHSCAFAATPDGANPWVLPMQVRCLFEQSRECETHELRDDVAPENNYQESPPSTRPLLLIAKSKRRRGEIAYSASLVNVDFTP